MLYLIDGSSQMYRAFHAPVRTNEGGFLRNAQGKPTNAVYIFVTMLRKLLIVNGQYDGLRNPDPFLHLANSRSAARRFFMILRARSIWSSKSGS